MYTLQASNGEDVCEVELKDLAEAQQVANLVYWLSGEPVKVFDEEENLVFAV